MPANTSPDNIVYPVASDQIAPLNAVFQDMAESVQDALSVRQVSSYRWANAAARGATVGMVAGDEGYQTDTRVQYIYTGSAWIPQSQGGLTAIIPTSVSGGTLASNGNITFSTSTGVSVNGCFTSAFSMYRIVARIDYGGVASTVEMRMRAGGVDNSSANYDRQILQGAVATPAAAEAIAATSWTAMTGGTRDRSTFAVDVLSPAIAAATMLNGSFQAWGLAGNGITGTYSGQHRLATAYDGFTIFPFSGSANLNGYLKVYGYA